MIPFRGEELGAAIKSVRDVRERFEPGLEEVFAYMAEPSFNAVRANPDDLARELVACILIGVNVGVGLVEGRLRGD